MSYLETLSKRQKDLIAMVHLAALPGTPGSRLDPSEVAARAYEEAEIYAQAGIQTVMLENMHDVPYTKTVGPEIPATMAVVAAGLKSLGLTLGIQILAGCNREALAVAHAAGLDFIRAEGFVFGHIGDEGYLDSCAGDLLRYRRALGAERVAVFTDLKKKHSSHAVTQDVDLAETAEAARFFLSDGVIVTGSSTGKEASTQDLEALQELGLPRFVGSGITAENLSRFFPHAEGFIVGSSLKQQGHWENPPDPHRVRELVEEFQRLREESNLR